MFTLDSTNYLLSPGISSRKDILLAQFHILISAPDTPFREIEDQSKSQSLYVSL